MSDDVRERALAELAQFEAAAFRFGHQARAFLAAFPQDMAAPVAVLPRFANGTDANHATAFGANSYMHLIVATAADADAWATLLQTPVEQNVTDEQESVSVTTKAEGVLDGLLVYVGCFETYTPAQWQRMQDSSSELDGAA